jgi:hypothetical protein
MKKKEYKEEITWIGLPKSIQKVGGYKQPKKETFFEEEEVLNFTQTMIMQYKFGNTNIEQMDLLKETLKQFKNK